MSTWKKLASGLGTLVVIAGLLAVGYLRWWNVFGQADLGAACSGRAGCKSFQCLFHAQRGGAEIRVAGYCTAPCDSDDDCKAAGLRCVVPSQAALDDLPALGRPKRLCQRRE